MKLLKKLKVDFFYVREMLRYGYWHPKFWFSYIKNRFFGGLLLKSTAHTRYEPFPELELHVLCQKSDLWMLIWALKSFLYHSGLKPSVIIHDDGSIDDSSVRTLTAIFPALSVLRRSEADKALAGNTEYSGIIRDFRENGHVLTLKLVDIFLLAKSKTVIVMDSDILFFAPPREIIDFVCGRSPHEALISGVSGSAGDFRIQVKKEYEDKYQLNSRGASLMNSGLIVYRRDALTVEKLREYFSNVSLSPENYFVEMTGWCCLVAQVSHMILPPDKYIIKGKPNSSTVMKHFTSSRRHEMFAWGISMAREAMSVKN